MNPEKKRRRSPYTASVDTVLVQFVAEMVPHDSPEFQERARRAAERPIPDHLRRKPDPEENPPAAT